MNLKQIEEAIATVEAQIRGLKQEGELKTGYWFDTAQNSKGTLYTRLCWHDGGKKKRRVLSDPAELAQWRVEVLRGDWLADLQRQLEEAIVKRNKIQEKLTRLAG